MIANTATTMAAAIPSTMRSDAARRRNLRVYWASTAVIAAVMLFSVYQMYSPLYAQLGFPGYFRTELVVAKLIGLVVLLVPGIPLRLKEWAYAGFAIVLVSAVVAHLGSGDSVPRAMEPLIFLAVLGISNRALHRR